MSDVKFDAQLGFKLPSEMKSALERVASRMRVPQEPAELLRQAASAIIECAAANGPENVPLEMAIVPRQCAVNPFAYPDPEQRSQSLVAEATDDQSHSSEPAAKAALQVAKREAQKSPLPAPRDPLKSPGAGLGKREKK
jgi:hypothetical protein